MTWTCDGCARMKLSLGDIVCPFCDKAHDEWRPADFYWVTRPTFSAASDGGVNRDFDDIGRFTTCAEAADVASRLVGRIRVSRGVLRPNGDVFSAGCLGEFWSGKPWLPSTPDKLQRELELEAAWLRQHQAA